jgi:hypothetical protein
MEQCEVDIMVQNDAITIVEMITHGGQNLHSLTHGADRSVGGRCVNERLPLSND